MTSSQNFFAGGGEMGERMRSLDWSKTALGPVEGWPDGLRSAVSICLGSRFPIVIYWGPRYVVLYNDAYAEILGKKHPWALGRPCEEVWSEIWGVIAPMLDGVVASGDATWSDDQLLVLERRGYPEECYFSFSFSPVRGAHGRVDGIFTAVIENTRRVLGERRLRTLRDLAGRAAAAKSEDEAWRSAAEGLAGNPRDLPSARLYRTGADGAPQNEDGALTLPIARPGAPAYGCLVAGLSPRRPLDDEYRGFLTLVADHIATAIANAHAYEEEKKRAEALAEIDRAKTAFFSNVSHEFRTPLTLMLGPLEDGLADAEAPLPPAQRERLELARRNGLRLQKLVNTMLDFSRIEAGRTQASYVPTELAALTADLASSFRSAIEKGGLRLAVDCAPLAQPAYVDHDMWEKIVFNLLSNALKFTFEGEIALGLRQRENSFELTVSDTGTGIPAAELPHVFERFRRVEGARSRTHEGTGIGLALVQELVRLHGGSVGVESVEGKGSAFMVSIPAGSAHLPAERIGAVRTLAPTTLGAEAFVEEALLWLPGESPATETPPMDGPRARIVWADDNADLREYVRRLLSTRYEVEAVADGEAALAAVRTRRPDLVLADVMMPRLDGLGLLRALRADPQTRTIPMVVLSARAGEEGRIEGLDAGADDYVTKPFSARELLARIAAQLEIARIRNASENALREADQRKDEFMAMLAHELRNPVAAIALGADLLKRAKLDDPKARFAAPAIERQAKQLQRLADDMLDMARATYGKLTLKKERIHLLEMAKAVAALHAKTRKTPKIEVAGEPAWVDGDAARVQQMIGNLIENAMKYGGTKIRVRVSRDPRWSRLSVQDDGQGIAPELLPDLFKPFVQGHQPLDRAQGGLGLGLALVNRLAALHGGRVEVQSEGPGKGSTFTISLPAAPKAAAGAKRASSGPVAERRRVLVVEDERDVREMLKFLLENEGHEVSIADNGVDGLAQFGSFRPDVALVDIGLPRMDGYELARRARLLPGGKEIRLIAITGYGQEKDRERARNAGFDLLVTKPVMYDQLVRAFET